ncbi:MAG: hypothetical protein WAN65_01000 [Candidatus Sulfotelmatobacter sp.]
MKILLIFTLGALAAGLMLLATSSAGLTVGLKVGDASYIYWSQECLK